MRHVLAASLVSTLSINSATDEIISMGGHERPRPTSKSPSVQSGDGFGGLLKRIEYLTSLLAIPRSI